MAKAHELITRVSNLPDGFDPEEAVSMVRDNLTDTDGEMHILMDLIEALWDEVHRLRYVLDQSKGEKDG